ncbi:aminotransferase class I/II-fold pyridoxal phosphate-dependent enzyme [Dactylosporangium matsuzakiense]|uniref:8-amino-7-oxononanoate synthase n=1 Tax=Dactylosporangium matsuzakiense TaxID=53360 RepID=A0A9W6KG59_9ACTN|nr:pyridoxal phosphate-dependent aminotransferase family protein [Dactylosporangium matsuzakiense]UWZ45992.1 pyridoxal phosphate-dependent aminotransferase family protein [Dactylosporangium matsuzakiense]GLL00105.1 2-amino-3-ketobutyrate CoA ligase [Dactylosporangium matsuzakiense]
MTVHPLHSNQGTQGAYVRKDGRWDDLERLRTTSPMYDAVVEEIDGRRIRVGSHWLTDWASCNYLGFDLEPEIMDAVDPYIRTWGTHPSWSRLLGNSRPYIDIEERLTELLGAPDTLLLPTITHIHMSVIPILAGDGTIFLDAQSHKTIYDGCMYAKGLGATVKRFRANDPEHLAELLAEAPAGKAKLIAMDGVNSMTGLAPDLARFAEVARQYDALLYVDEAHGFGVIGERREDETSPYGSRGNAIVKYAGETYDNIVLVGGFSKSYSSLMAFLALPTWLKNHLKVAAPPYLYSGPSPTASLATVMAGLDVNEKRGDEIRAELYRKTMRVLDHVRSLGVHTPNTGTTPIIELPLAPGEDIAAVGQYLWDHETYVTLAAYPLVPRDQVGFRVQVTAANTDAEIDQLNGVLTQLAGAGRLLRTDVNTLGRAA